MLSGEEGGLAPALCWLAEWLNCSATSAISLVTKGLECLSLLKLGDEGAGASPPHLRAHQRLLLPLWTTRGKGVALPNVARFQSFSKPAYSLFRSAVGE